MGPFGALFEDFDPGFAAAAESALLVLPEIAAAVALGALGCGRAVAEALVVAAIALVAAGAFLYLRPFANAGENAVAIVVAIGGVGVLVAVAAAAVLGSDTVLDEAAKAAVIIELGVLVLTVLLPLAAGVARLPGQHKGAKIPTSKAHISVGIHSFWLIFGRVIISRHGLEA